MQQATLDGASRAAVAPGGERYTRYVFDSLADTICAVATPPGIGGIAVIRVSGRGAFEISDRILLQKRPCGCYRSHTLHRAVVVDDDEHVDDVLVSVFRAPHSYTGEDLVEISCHGGQIPVARTMQLLLRHGCLPAEPGEFTKRAFMNGRLDLAQAEAVCDLINAKTREAHRQAAAQQIGALSRKAQVIRNGLLGVLAQIEASIDFPEDVGELNFIDCRDRLVLVLSEIRQLLDSADRGIMIRAGAQVVLVGQPNSGKSSLMNALLRTDRAIVTEIAGTTRDTLEETLNLNGIAVRLWDTAGLRPTDDLIETIGIARTRTAVESADLLLLVVDSTAGLSEDDHELLKAIGTKPCLVVWNKSDLNAVGQISVSAKTGDGITELEDAIAEQLLGENRDATSSPSVTHARQKSALEHAMKAVIDALETIESRLPADFLSIDVRAAVLDISEITGETASEDVINEIFSRFCIGK